MLFEELDNYSRNGYSCVIFGGTDKAAKILAEDLHDKGYKADYAKNPKKFYLGRITVVEGILSAGFEYPEEKIAVLTRTSASSSKTSVFAFFFMLQYSPCARKTQQKPLTMHHKVLNFLYSALLGKEAPPCGFP